MIYPTIMKLQKKKNENTLTCSNCGKIYYRRGKRKLASRHGSCCSLVCSHSHVKGKKPIRTNPKKGRVRSCNVCTKQFYVCFSQKRKYCSIACRSLDIVEIGKRSGPNHYKWKGGRKAHRGVDRELRRWKRLIIKRDGRKCAKCGETGGIVCIDHILPWSCFKNYRYVTANGQTLCKKCHNDKTKIENRSRDIKGNLKNEYKQRIKRKYETEIQRRIN